MLVSGAESRSILIQPLSLPCETRMQVGERLAANVVDVSTSVITSVSCLLLTVTNCVSSELAASTRSVYSCFASSESGSPPGTHATSTAQHRLRRSERGRAGVGGHRSIARCYSAAGDQSERKTI